MNNSFSKQQARETNTQNHDNCSRQDIRVLYASDHLDAKIFRGLRNLVHFNLCFVTAARLSEVEKVGLDRLSENLINSKKAFRIVGVTGSVSDVSKTS